jgi:hypothetical protein
MVTQVTNSVVPEAMAFRIFQDMRGVQATYRITTNTTTTLTQAVTITDDIIYVDNASALSEPDFAANIWGVITINGERIMYRDRNTTENTVSSLLRGTAGTGASAHNIGANVYDMGRGNLLPEQFQNYIIADSSLADGFQVVFNAPNINLVEGYSTTPFSSATSNNQPGSYDYDPFIGSPLLVYVAGELQTSGYVITQLNMAQVTFSFPPPAGAEVTLAIRRGVTWYQQGIDPLSASNGVPLQETNTPAALFLRGIS